MINIHWPSGDNNYYAPWYLIVPRLVLTPVLLLLLVSTAACIMLGWGVNEARAFLRDNL